MGDKLQGNHHLLVRVEAGAWRDQTRRDLACVCNQA